MFRWAAFLGLIGLGIATAVIVWSGWTEVLQALEKAGWGIVAVAGFHIVPLVVSSVGWHALLSAKRKASVLSFVYYMWIRAAVNDLMPVARIGGEIAAVRLMVADGMRESIAIAITVVELTLSVVAVFVFVALGALMFAVHVADADVSMQMAWGLLLSLPLIAGLIAVQRIGFFGLLYKLFRVAFRDKWASLAGSAARLDRAVTAVYKRKGRAIACTVWQFIAWVLGAGEVWLALVFLGHPLTIMECAMIEALIQGSVTAAFAIPGALGVQEAGFLLFAGMLGVPHETGAALAVIRRCRDLMCSVPGLIVWQIEEGRRLLKP